MTVRFDSQAEPIPGYRLIERLGSGGFGEVWKAEAPGGIFKAIKIVFGDINSQDRDVVRFAEQELKALKRVKQVRHPYLLALDRYDIVEGRLLITMELADCNLWDRFRDCRKRGLPGIPRNELLTYMSEASEVLDLMNDQFQLQHLDIKPQNLFLLYNHVKVADFGQVKDLEGMAAQVTGGITPVYAAPETFDGIISRYCDQYSLACVYQELLTGQRPFEGSTMQQLLMQHLQMPPNLGPSPSHDRPALARALSKKPDERFPSCMAMVRALREGTEAALRVGLPAAPPSAIADAVNRTSPPADPAAVSDRIEVKLDSSGSVPVSAIIEARPAAPSRTPPSVPSSRSSTSFPNPLTATETSTWESSIRASEPAVEEQSFESAPLLGHALPLETGPGSLRPTLVVGAGFTGLRVLQRFRKLLGDRFGSPDRTPLIRTLYIDTDPDALAAAVADPQPGLARLRPDEIFAAKLNRAQHYLKPRLSGRSLIEGWFDTQLLYRLPRNPVTMGLRVFGRLAFCDHYRAMIQKIQSELEACLHPDALTTTLATTGLALRTNRPRVYIAAGLGGGTGSGMFLDLAYTIRARLKRLGYADAEVVGVLHLPPEGEHHPQTQANVYASLTELHHFSRPETLFSAMYDDRPSLLRETESPFHRVYILPGLPSGMGAHPTPIGSGSSGTMGSSRGAVNLSGTMRAPTHSSRSSGVWSRSGTIGPPSTRSSAETAPPADRDPCTTGAELVRLDLLTAIGRIVDEAEYPDRSYEQLGSVRSAGLTRFSWPRGEVIARTGRLVAHSLVNHWVSPGADHVRSIIPQWVGERWSAIVLDPHRLEQRFRDVIEAAAGCRIEDAVLGLTEPLVPKGWLSRLPDPERVSVAIDQIRRIIGRPGGKASLARVQTEVELALAATADHAADVAAGDAAHSFMELFELPEFRPAGTEEALRQFLGMLDETSAIFEQRAADLEHAGGTAYDLLVGYVHYQRGMRKPSATEFTDALRCYPDAQHQAIIARSLVHVYQRVRAALVGLLNEVETCRHRVEGLLPFLAPDPNVGVHLPTQRDLYPVGCNSVSESSKRFVDVLSDDDLIDLDRRVQEALVARQGGLFHTCLNATDGLASLLELVQEETRTYLDERLGEVDLAGMFWQRYGTPDAIVRELHRAYEEAEPALVGPGPWAKEEIAVFAGPAGLGGNPIRELAASVLPATMLADETHDEVVIVREYPAVPLSALSQLGPTWAAAYQSAYDIQQTTAHSRLDVTRWIDVDSV